MALNKGMMESVKGNAEEIRKLIANIPDEPRKQAALRYCDDCIAATSLVIELLDNEEKTAEKKQSVKQEAAVTAAPIQKQEKNKTPEEEAAVDLFAEPMDLF